jgi:hypothetical protein
MRGETYERRLVRDFEAARHPGVDYSIPDADCHAKHIADIARANNGRGFPAAVSSGPTAK